MSGYGDNTPATTLRGAAWQEDTASCTLCDVPFGPLSRRHHCRVCGRCVCGPCSPSTVLVPGQAMPQRTCTPCIKVVQHGPDWHARLCEMGNQLQAIVDNTGQSGKLSPRPAASPRRPAGLMPASGLDAALSHCEFMIAPLMTLNERHLATQRRLGQKEAQLERQQEAVETLKRELESQRQQKLELEAAQRELEEERRRRQELEKKLEGELETSRKRDAAAHGLARQMTELLGDEQPSREQPAAHREHVGWGPAELLFQKVGEIRSMITHIHDGKDKGTQPPPPPQTSSPPSDGEEEGETGPPSKSPERSRVGGRPSLRRMFSERGMRMGNRPSLGVSEVPSSAGGVLGRTSSTGSAVGKRATDLEDVSSDEDAVWEENTDTCGACGVALGKLRLRRRHHCRICKRCVCAGCSPNLVQLQVLGSTSLQRACCQCISNAENARSVQKRMFRLGRHLRLLQGSDAKVAVASASLTVEDAVDFCEAALTSLEEAMGQTHMDIAEDVEEREDKDPLALLKASATSSHPSDAAALEAGLEEQLLLVSETPSPAISSSDGGDDAAHKPDDMVEVTGNPFQESEESQSPRSKNPFDEDVSSEPVGSNPFGDYAEVRPAEAKKAAPDDVAFWDVG
eukprot:TRINITY_DN34925_c0_g1_i1.p1 TRINITY_DN34925_c0_g1~~TRINITY_DN34925_c0_g1_i1.p1  ORF type:complete len:627 (-),score=150.71 TRINITY_DN34925_c0_g1_i1:443-2323(-)